MDGQPVVWVRSKNFDKGRNFDDAVAAAMWMLNDVSEGMTADAAGPQQLTCVYDRRGFSLRKNLDLDLVKAMIDATQNNFPERLARVIVFPTGPVLRTLWKMVRLFMDAKTRSKVEFMAGPDSLHQYIDASQLPVDCKVRGAAHYHRKHEHERRGG